MRHILLALLIGTTATPTLAQTSADVDRRVDRLERELRAVQRKVFPGGSGAAGAPLAPEIAAPAVDVSPSGVPATSALADLTARLDALEGQLRTLTGQAEENAHRLTQMERGLTELRNTTDSRLKAIEQPAPEEAAEAPMPSEPAKSPASSSAAPLSSANGDPAEEAYLKGFRAWDAGKFVEAQTTLEAMVKKYPKHPRISFAQNLLGRAYLDGGKPATAAKILLGNYENNRNGERAPDSLFYLGKALVELNQPANACKVYEELEAVYGSKLRAALKNDLPKARAEAKCG